MGGAAILPSPRSRICRRLFSPRIGAAIENRARTRSDRDKMLVASCMLVLAAAETIKGWSVLAAISSCDREIMVCRPCEGSLARDARRAWVTKIAKWKTSSAGRDRF